MGHAEGASSPAGVVGAHDEPVPGRAGDWLTPGRPRLLAAALTLVAAAVSVLSAAGLADFYGVYRAGAIQAVLFWLPLLGGAVALAAVAGLLLTGSRVARVLGGAAVLALSLQTIAPWLSSVMRVGQVTDRSALVLALPVTAVALLHVAVVVALAVPLPARRPTG